MFVLCTDNMLQSVQAEKHSCEGKSTYCQSFHCSQSLEVFQDQDGFAVVPEQRLLVWSHVLVFKELPIHTQHVFLCHVEESLAVAEAPLTLNEAVIPKMI